MNVLLSIHPKWADKIYSGEKTIEFRKSFPKNFDFQKDRVFLYETAPVKKVTGSITLLSGSQVKKVGYDGAILKKGGIAEDALKAYAGKGSGFFYCWLVDKVTKYETEQELVWYAARAPQSWVYANENSGARMPSSDKVPDDRG